jgi:hypothetical protein
MTWFRRSAHPEEDLSAYVDGELGERARRAVETHLASCEACSTLLRELQDAKSLLSELPKLEPRRSLTLGPEHAAERRAAPAPRRMSFTFAPAVALSVLVALLFVDAIDSGGGSSHDQAFNTAGSTAASRAAEEPAAGGGLAPESATKDEANSTLGAADSSTTQDGSDAGGAAAGAAELAPPTQSLESSAPNAAASAEQSPAEDSGAAIPESTPEAAEAPAPMPSVTGGESDDSATDTTAAVPQEPPRTSQPEDANGSSGGLSTLRILEIIAALAFVVSLAAVFLPRIVGREER